MTKPAQVVVMTRQMAEDIAIMLEDRSPTVWQDDIAALQAIASGEVRMAMRCDYGHIPNIDCPFCHSTGWRLHTDKVTSMANDTLFSSVDRKLAQEGADECEKALSRIPTQA